MERRSRTQVCWPTACVVLLAGCGHPMEFEVFPSCEDFEASTALGLDEAGPAGFTPAELVNHLDSVELQIVAFETYDEGNRYQPAPGPIALSVSYAGGARAIVRDSAPRGIAVGRGSACLLGDLVAADVVVTYLTPGDGSVPAVPWTVEGTLEATSLEDPYLMRFELVGEPVLAKRDLTPEQEALVAYVIGDDGTFESLDGSMFGSLGFGDGGLSGSIGYRRSGDHRTRWFRGTWGSRLDE